MNNDEMQKILEQAIREHVIDQQHDTVPVPLPENMRFHVNCYVKKRQNEGDTKEQSDTSTVVHNNKYWDNTNPRLFQLELRAMALFFPDAKLYKRENLGVFWAIDLETSEDQKYKKWKFLLLYDENHPHNQSLGIASVRAYPVKPNYEEIKMMMDSWSDDERKRALSRARFRKDVNGLIYLYTGTVINEPQKVVSAAGIALRVQNWLDLFEKSMLSKKYRELFCNMQPITFDDETYKTILSEAGSL